MQKESIMKLIEKLKKEGEENKSLYRYINPLIEKILKEDPKKVSLYIEDQTLKAYDTLMNVEKLIKLYTEIQGEYMK